MQVSRLSTPAQRIIEHDLGRPAAPHPWSIPTIQPPGRPHPSTALSTADGAGQRRRVTVDHADRMPPSPAVPDSLRDRPFRGSAAVRAGLLTRGQLTGPSWRRLFPDIYLHAAAPRDHFTHCEAAALLLPPGAAIAGRSAAYVLSAAVMPQGEPPVDVAVPATTSMRSRPGLRVVRTRLAPGDVMRSAGLPLTAPVRTGFDLARRPGLVDAVVAVDALLHSRLVTPAELAAYAAERRDWTGGPQALRVLPLASPLAESPMETRLRLLLVLAGLPPPRVQHPVGSMRLDLAYPEARLGVEYEGDHHRDRRQFSADLARANRLRLLGWTVLRFTADDVLRHPGRTVDQVTKALGPHLLRL
jgi:very-short-patch-repair endonuclease